MVRVVLGYIFNNARRFHTFVSNRVQQIRDLTSVDQWRYIATKSNPADIASRGLNAQCLINKKEWWFGLESLWTDFDPQYGKIEEDNAIGAVRPEDPEVRKSSVLNRFSSWHRAKRAMAVCLRYRKILLAVLSEKQTRSASEGNRKNITANPLSVDQLNEARKEIIRIVQRNSFVEEVSLLRPGNVEALSVKDKGKENQRIPKSSNLYRLDPILTKDGLR